MKVKFVSLFFFFRIYHEGILAQDPSTETSTTTDSSSLGIAGTTAPPADSGLPCSDDPNQAKCCPMSDAYGSHDAAGNPCIIANMVGNLGETCSMACELKYKSLGHQCWITHHNGVYWYNMQKLCDPTNVSIIFIESPGLRCAVSETRYL